MLRRIDEINMSDLKSALYVVIMTSNSGNQKQSNFISYHIISPLSITAYLLANNKIPFIIRGEPQKGRNLQIKVQVMKSNELQL